MKLAVLAAAAAVSMGAPALARAGVDPCAAAARRLAAPHLTVSSAQTVQAGTSMVLDRGLPTFQAPVTFCRIVGVSRPSPDSDIVVEVWMPAGKAWNGRYLQAGNGGFAGSIEYPLMALALKRGFAVAATDDGHESAQVTDASFALNHPQKVTDFGWRSLRETTLAARAAILAYERRRADRSYFYGCSDGGREALMEAQRFPDDFDGIVAGAPASNWTRLVAGGGLLEKTLLEPGRFIAPAKLPMLQAAALKACGGAGGYVENPLACRFDPTVLACAPGVAATTACLTPGEVEAAKMAYAGVTGPDGYAYPGLMPGAEAEPGSWAAWVTGEAPGKAAGYAFPWNYFAYLVLSNPAFDLRNLTFADIAESQRKLAGVLNATDPDLSAFRAHGGKLIQYHGWNDPAISPLFSTRYYDSVRTRMGDPSGFYRLYMIPGMLHCGGGAAPSQVDWLALLQAWVEQGRAPAAVTARDGKGASQTLKPWGQ